jgi:hypothetical protein
MSKKYKVNLDKNALTQVQVYKKGREKYLQLKIYDACEVILDEIPKSKKIENRKNTIVKKLRFTKLSDYEEQLSFPHELSEVDKNLIATAHEELNYYELEDQGWIFKEEYYLIFGEFDAIEVEEFKLELITSEREICEAILSTKDFKRIVKNGIPQETYDDLMDSSSESGSVFNELTMLSLDGVEVKNFQNNFKKIYAKEVEKLKINKRNSELKKLKYAFVRDSWIKCSNYGLIIYEEFDSSKLGCNVSLNKIFGSNQTFITYSMTYDGKDFEFDGGDGPSSVDDALVDSSGNQYEFSIIESDDEYDE